MMVEAGAVAEPIAPSSRENGTDRRKTKIMVKVTSIPAARDSHPVRIRIFQPLFFSCAHLKYFPTPKAMKASAMSVTNPIPPIISAGISPNTQGPIRIPARI